MGRSNLILAILVVVAAAGCSRSPSTSTTGTAAYTGRLRIDAGTEYVALDVPSPIGGACEGWNTVQIRKPGISGSGMTNIICWKRSGDMITITDRGGTAQKSGPASVWSD